MTRSSGANKGAEGRSSSVMTQPEHAKPQQPGGADTDRDADLAAMFQRELAPQVATLEARRLALVSRTRTIAWAAVVVCLAIAGLALAFGSLVNPVTLTVVVGGFLLGPVIALTVYSSANTSFANEVLAAVMPVLCRFVGDLSYEHKTSTHPDPKRFRDLLVVDDFNTCEAEDGFEGTHRNTAFRMVEVHLFWRRGKSTTTVFTGLLLTVSVPATFTGRIIVVQRHGDWRKRLGQALAPGRQCDVVLFDDAPFEALFEVYTDHPDDARRLLAPSLRDTLVMLAQDYDLEGPRGAFRAAFDGGEFLVAIPQRGTLFEVSGMHRPLADLGEQLVRLLEEVTIPHRIIDYLHGDRPAPSRRR